ncbi:MAG: helix-turn-helix domain-containing protein [Candidatus Thiocaldithrix dubininis]|jgi:DNA-binding protein Fis|uniref:Helix-turn-helix domain-containing protein n=1 Tax=Candidatus Thiocaldithrix dubininis TaxID=3080823 RepID=A0AA95HCF9_9GAMM|nr:MAG: helix-turn-helix domain-containing protein [Candidatus Thiocaldithrix dubininis]
MSDYQTPIETAAHDLTTFICQNSNQPFSFLWSSLIGFAELGILKAALEHNQGNQCKTAKQLGLHRSTLRQRIALYGLQQHGKA